MFIRAVVVFLLFCSAASARAQDAPEKWYFAFNKESGALVAYNLNGQQNILLTRGVTGMNTIGTRLSDDEALLLLRVDEQFGLYYATPTQITRLVGEDGIVQVPLATAEGVAVMVNQYEGKPVYASVFRDGSLTPLPNRVIGRSTYARFSQDGRYFRAVGPDDSGSFFLWNVDTVSGEAAPVFEFGAEVPLLRPDASGDRWMQRLSLADGQASYRLIRLDGSVEELGTFDEATVTGSFHMLGSDLVSYPDSCDESCTFEVRSSPPQSFLADSQTFRGLPVALLGDDGLLILNQNDQFYRASAAAAPQLIGSFTRDRFHIFGASFQAVSPDRRWLMTVDDRDNPTQHLLHDLTTGEIVARYDFSKPPSYLKQVLYGDGLIVFKLNDGGHDFLLYGDGDEVQTIRQPRGTNIRVYFEVLPGQQALYRTADPYSGIVLHDLKAGTETVLLDGAWEYISLIRLT